MMSQKHLSVPENVCNVLLQVEGTEECTICHTVAQELQDLDRSATVQKAVEDFVKQNLCSRLGSLESEVSAEVWLYLLNNAKLFYIQCSH